MEKNTYKSDLQKKGIAEEVGNYRPIRTLPALCKLFSAVRNDRLYNRLVQAQSEHQGGFRRSYQTARPSGNMQTAGTEMPGVGVPKCGSISHLSLWNTLEKCGIESHHINFLRRLYAEQKGTVSTDTDSDMFEIKRGTKEGDPSSSLLLHTVLEMAMKDTCWWIGVVFFQKQNKKGAHIDEFRVDFGPSPPH